MYAVIIGDLFKISGIKLKKFVSICCIDGELAGNIVGHMACAKYCILYCLRSFGEEKIVN